MKQKGIVAWEREKKANLTLILKEKRKNYLGFARKS